MANPWLNVDQIIELTEEMDQIRSRRTVLTALRAEVFGEKRGRAWRATRSETREWIRAKCPTRRPELPTLPSVGQPPPGETLNLAEAAKYVFLSPNEVRQQVKAKRLRRYGDVFHIQDLDRFVREYGEERVPIMGVSTQSEEEQQIGVLINGVPFPWEITEIEDFMQERLETASRIVRWPTRIADDLVSHCDDLPTTSVGERPHE